MTKQKALSVILGKKSEKPCDFFDKMHECPHKIVAIDPKTGHKIMTFAYAFSTSGVCSGFITLSFDPVKSIKNDDVLETYLNEYGWSCLTTGQGKAGGYGYCKMSAAFQACLRDMNIEIFGNVCGYDGSKARRKQPASVAGAGKQAVETVMLSICHAVGHRKVILIDC